MEQPHSRYRWQKVAKKIKHESPYSTGDCWKDNLSMGVVVRVDVVVIVRVLDVALVTQCAAVGKLAAAAPAL